MLFRNFGSRDVSKVVRFIWLYGFRRTVVKILSRTGIVFNIRLLFPPELLTKKINSNGQRILIVGAGHHAFSTLAFYILKHSRDHKLYIYDSDVRKSQFCADCYGGEVVAALNDVDFPDLDIAFIASNHASHASYAIDFLKRNVDVFIEKPICVDSRQAESLFRVSRRSAAKMFCGFNRPFSATYRRLIDALKLDSGPITLNFTVLAHVLEKDHWYRQGGEGSRILGNGSHWLDLSVFLLAKLERSISYIDISLSVSDSDSPDDNFSISLITDTHDLINIVFSSRGEPKNGVAEYLVAQRGSVVAICLDHRTLELTIGKSTRSIRTLSKNQGHEGCIFSALDREFYRNLKEIESSTALQLFIESMLSSNRATGRFVVK